MFQGTVVSISITPSGGEPMRLVGEVRAVAGKGLEGDRYFQQAGTFSERGGSDRQVTLIEAEAIESLARESGVELEYGDARRNIVTRGVPLNHLVEKEFVVGEVAVRGIRLCEPCAHLASLTDQKVLPGLVHRGGLRAEILSDGVIRVGDGVRPQAS